MRVPGLKALTLAGRWWRSRFERGGLILGYHRLAEPRADVYGLCVRPSHFAEHLEVLRRFCAVMPLGDLIQRMQGGRLPSRSVALTFDDGYADFLTEARPRLERYAAPATLFVVSGALGQAYWWDELADALMLARPQTDELRLRIGADITAWRLGRSSKGQTGTVERSQIVLDIHRRLMAVPYEERCCLLAQIKDWAGVLPTAPASSRCLTASELSQLDSELVDIGAHSVNHSPLATLPTTCQRSEIQDSKKALEAVLNRPITGFSYPHGSVSHATRTLVQAAGFAYACGSQPDMARQRSHCYELPRFWVPDCDGDAFARWLRFWLLG